MASLEGTVEVERSETLSWLPASLEDPVCEGDAVRAGVNSRAAIRLINDAVLRLDQNTTVQLTNITDQPEERSFLALLRGVLQSFSRKPRLLAINTPYLNGSVEGTEFLITSSDAESSITVFEGVVNAENPQGEVSLASGEMAVAQEGKAPVKRIVVKPRDAVQWAIYYPPLLLAGPPPADAPGELTQALTSYREGDAAGALEMLDQVPAAQRNASYHLYRASLLLSVGRVDQAEAAIDEALTLKPESARAQALQSVIAVAQDDRETALAAGERAVELDPEIAASWIALSYAQQARFDLEGARTSIETATEVAPEDPLAWSRLAEIRLALGNRAGAREAAERSARLAPESSRNQTVLGFANLVEFRIEPAKQAFERAIAGDPADPLPRLGLGLAKIRAGNLAAGRADIEVAASLDPNNALIRSYLGKAYFEEKRAPLDAEQFAIAEDLDPLDPTAFLYDAIRLQTENRPVEGLHQLQRSIELNDNRAVYRSRLLLDSDRAARGTSLARIYDDLGFTEVGALEATSSLTFDPSNAGAHRFLSDVYRDVRRRESARVSELLQAQMLQDININPVQPSLSETNLNVVTQGGPSDAGFNEFTPLFEQNGAQLDVSGLVGNDNTVGGEVVASALYDRFSISAGGYGFGTDGWRENHDIRHSIFNVYAQAAVTPELNAQVELRTRETKNGDLDFNFDPNDFFPNFEQKLNQDSARLGLRYSPAVHSDLLLSLIYSDRDEDQSDMFDTFFGPGELKGTREDEGYQLEGQYILRQEHFNVVAGGQHSDFNANTTAFLSAGGIPLVDVTESGDVGEDSGYIYGTVNLPKPVTWTLGLSYVDFEEFDFKRDEVNPKFGVQWNITDRLQLRGAVFQVVKPALANNRTLEPTQVAGFNQLFDDNNGTKSLRYGIGLDYSPLGTVFIGAEATERKLDTPFFNDDLGRTTTVDQTEQNVRGYINWTPTQELALSAEVIYDHFESDRSLLTIQDTVPEDLKTFSVPLTARYFHPSGFFAGLRGTYVNQDVDRSPDQIDGLAEGQDDFFLVDVSIGYRLPKRFGVVGLDISNLFDTEFNYQDDSFREFGDDPSIGPYIPDQRIIARATINW